MKKFLLTLLVVPAIVFGQTYPSPTFSSLTLQNPLTVANGGTGATTATGTGSLVLSSSPTIANPTITGSLGATGLVTTGDLATQAANTIIANATASTASPTAIVIPSCSGATSALGWSSGSGPVCNSSINAATLGGATFASPGPIGSGTASSGAFTTLSASTSNPSLNYLATGTGAVARSYASKFGDVVSAIDFGADPTGTVSSTAAIQAAIDAVTAKGGTVFLPIGTYKMTAPLVFPNAQFVSLIGAGKGSRLLNSTGTSFDMITWTNIGACCILSYSTIGNLQLSQSGASGSGAEINTQFASNVNINDVYFADLAVSGDGVKITGYGSTYSHEVQINNFSGRSSTGNSVIHLTGTASDDLISGGIFEGLGGVVDGIQIDNGAGTVQIQNLHISNFASNVILAGTMVGVLQVTNSIFDSSKLETAYFNGLTNAVFVNTHFMFPGSGHSAIYLNNSSGNQFKSTIVESASGSNAAWGVFETGSSNSNTFDGLTATGTFTGGIASLAGTDSVVNPTGHEIVLSSNGSITAGGTLYFSSGPANTAQNLAQFQMPYPGYIRKVMIASVNAPGASQTYTATVQNSGSSTGVTATISGASSFGATATNFVPVAEGDAIGVQVVASAGAAASNLRVTLVIGY